MSFALDDLMTPATSQEIEQSIYDCLSIVGTSTPGWKPGSVVRTIIKATAVMLAAFSVLIAAIARGGYLEYARGSWLTLLARWKYGVERLEETTAAGQVTVTNTGGGIYAFDAGDFRISTEDGSREFVNLEAFELAGKVPTGKSSEALIAEAAALDTLVATLETRVAAHPDDQMAAAALSNARASREAKDAEIAAAALEEASGPTATVAVRALTPGAQGSAAAGTVTTVVAQLPDLHVTNEQALVGTEDEEDTQLRERCLDKVGAGSANGPLDIYQYTARSARRADGTPIGVVRIRHTKDGYGNVDLYCATPSGALNDPDLAVIDAAIQKAAPQCVNARTHSAINVTLPISYRVWAWDTGHSAAEIQEAVAYALAQWARRVPVGGDAIDGIGRVYRSAISGVIGSARIKGVSLGIFRVELDSPAVDLTLDIMQVPVIGTINGTVHVRPNAAAAA